MTDNEMNNVPEVGLKFGTVEGQSGSTAAGVGGDGDVGTTITTESGVKCHCCLLLVSDVSVLQCLWFLVSVLHCWIHHVEEKVQILILRCLRWFLSAPAADEFSVRDSNFGSELINVCLCGEVIKDGVQPCWMKMLLKLKSGWKIDLIGLFFVLLLKCSLTVKH